MATTSGFLKLNGSDFLKGLLVAAITPVFTIIETSVQAGSLTFDWKAIGLTALAGGMAYLAKNLFTPAPPATPSLDTSAIPTSPKQ